MCGVPLPSKEEQEKMEALQDSMYKSYLLTKGEKVRTSVPDWRPMMSQVE
jgi:hypothetical protein